MAKTKRPATEAEIAEAKRTHIAWMVAQNCYGDEGEVTARVEKKLAEAMAEGYKNETCSCGTIYLAFHHFTTCREEGCPFSDGVSLLDRMESCESSELSGTEE